MYRKLPGQIRATRGSNRQNATPARTEVLSARGEESKPVAHPCRGPGGQAGDHQKRQGHPLSGAREPWLAPNVIACLLLVSPRRSPCLTVSRASSCERYSQYRDSRIAHRSAMGSNVRPFLVLFSPRLRGGFVILAPSV